MTAAPPVLTGERVTLRPATGGDALHIARWAAEPEFAWMQWGRLPGRFGSLEEARAAFIDRFVPPEAALFIIEQGDAAIGFANYRDLRRKARSCEIGIGIGEPGLWGKGLGREALGLLVRHLTGDLGLHRITLHVMRYNHRAIAAYRASGFRVEGILTDAVMTGRGTFTDSVEMAYIAGRGRPAFDPVPVTLAGRHVRLEPLRLAHAGELWMAGSEEEIWRHLSWGPPRSVADMEEYVRSALDEQTLGNQLPWLTRRLSDGLALGTTRFASIDRANRSAEIGYTFLSQVARRTPANTEAKYLQLRHAFETLGALRVWLQTDEANERSRRAMERIGARFEGTRRRDRIVRDGLIRSSAVFSFTDEEWPGIRTHLERLLS